MQTFLPYPDFPRSVATLDRRRLGKQRVETYQILLTLLSVRMWDWDRRIVIPRHSPNMHAAIRLWAGNERALLRYQQATCEAWTSLGYRDTCLDKSRFIVDLIDPDLQSNQDPPWMGDPHLHRTHRSNLVWKEFHHYGPLFPDDVPDRPDDPEDYWAYVWPNGRLDLRNRKEEHYQKAVTLLGEESHVPARAFPGATARG